MMKRLIILFAVAGALQFVNAQKPELYIPRMLDIKGVQISDDEDKIIFSIPGGNLLFDVKSKLPIKYLNFDSYGFYEFAIIRDSIFKIDLSDQKKEFRVKLSIPNTYNYGKLYFNNKMVLYNKNQRGKPIYFDLSKQTQNNFLEWDTTLLYTNQTRIDTVFSQDEIFIAKQDLDVVTNLRLTQNRNHFCASFANYKYAVWSAITGKLEYIFDSIYNPILSSNISFFIHNGKLTSTKSKNTQTLPDGYYFFIGDSLLGNIVFSESKKVSIEVTDLYTGTKKIHVIDNIQIPTVDTLVGWDGGWQFPIIKFLAHSNEVLVVFPNSYHFFGLNTFICTSNNFSKGEIDLNINKRKLLDNIFNLENTDIENPYRYYSKIIYKENSSSRLTIRLSKTDSILCSLNTDSIGKSYDLSYLSTLCDNLSKYSHLPWGENAMITNRKALLQLSNYLLYYDIDSKKVLSILTDTTIRKRSYTTPWSFNSYLNTFSLFTYNIDCFGMQAGKNSLYCFDLLSGTLVKTKILNYEKISSILSVDNNSIFLSSIYGDNNSSLIKLDLSSDSLVSLINFDTFQVRNIHKYIDTTLIFCFGENAKSQTNYLIGYETSKMKKVFQIAENSVYWLRDVVFLNKNVLITILDNQIKFWDISKSKEIFSLFPVNGSDWVITSPSGLFDASPGAMKLMYYVAGLEVIELDQLKERYYEPGLLQKLLGYNKEPLRNVESFADVKLYPEIKLSLNEKRQDAGCIEQLQISLKNRGGGIGQTVVYINGKEISSDVRGAKLNPNADSANVSIDIAKHPYLKDGENSIEVKVYNTEGYLVSRGVKINYTSTSTSSKDNPSLYTVCIGTSNYTGNQIDLKYAAKDASDISKAFGIGAKNLFGADKVYTYLINTDSTNSLQPTKLGIKRVFEEISKKAKSEDVIVVYLSGHGINWGGQDGDFFYLTKDAYTANIEAYNDPAIRASTTLSSAELTELIKSVPALKQVLILDACASGRAVENLIAKRDISSSTLRALDRMKDRTGMHIITGCAADAVSYEASRYGQGILTYSLLEGIKGAALREGKFADVNLIFQHARERVPQLAGGIGGIQEPKVFSPYGAESFDIGELSDADKSLVPLANAKPMFIRSNFIDIDQSEDALNLGGLLDNALMETSSRRPNAPLIFLDVKDFGDAYKLSGSYQQTENAISIKLKIKTQKSERKSELKAKNVGELKRLILLEIDNILK